MTQKIARHRLKITSWVGGACCVHRCRTYVQSARWSNVCGVSDGQTSRPTLANRKNQRTLVNSAQLFLATHYTRRYTELLFLSWPGGVHISDRDLKVGYAIWRLDVPCDDENNPCGAHSKNNERGEKIKPFFPRKETFPRMYRANEGWSQNSSTNTSIGIYTQLKLTRRMFINLESQNVVFMSFFPLFYVFAIFYSHTYFI